MFPIKGKATVSSAIGLCMAPCCRTFRPVAPLCALPTTQSYQRQMNQPRMGNLTDSALPPP